MLFQKRFEELFLLTEQQFEIALGSRLGPCFRHKLPVVVWFCINRSHLFNFFHQIVALVELAAVDDSAVKTVFRDSGTLGKEFAAAISTIAVNGYLVPFFLIERLAVAHAQNLHLLAIWLGYVNFVIDSRSTIKVEREILETEALLVANGLLIEQQEMVVRALHGVHPEVVTHF